MFIASQILILVLVLILPLTVHRIEKNLEIFLFVMGILSSTISHFFGPEKIWSLHIVKEALLEPVKITVAVVCAGYIFNRYREKITKKITHVEQKLGPHFFAFFFIFFLGLLSSIITAIIAAIVLVEIINALHLERRFEINLTIIACFAIGLGAVLTPVGEPLSTIATAKLKGQPYNAGFLFLFKHMWYFVIPGVILSGIIGAFLRTRQSYYTLSVEKHLKGEGVKEILLRAGKVYIFVMALIFLGAGFKPFIDLYVVPLGNIALYWINTVSAVLDNATLASAEISPKMKIDQIQFALMGLLISGGMLIPGNIPNIIAASKLNIKSKEWARFGVPFGFALLILYFVLMYVFLLSRVH